MPFLLKAGKALASRRAEIRVQFRHVPGNLFRNRLGLDLDRATNELARLGHSDSVCGLRVRPLGRRCSNEYYSCYHAPAHAACRAAPGAGHRLREACMSKRLS